MHREVTLKQIGYVVSGTATINLWGGGKGDIDMKPTRITELTTENVLRAINDNGFGCESFDSADVVICTDFGYNLQEYYAHVEFNRDDLWLITNRNADFKQIAKDYEENHRPIIDVEYIQDRIAKLKEGAYMSNLVGDFEMAHENEELIKDLETQLQRVL